MSRSPSVQPPLALPGLRDMPKREPVPAGVARHPFHPLLPTDADEQSTERRQAVLRLLRLALDLGAMECGGPLTEAEREVVATVPPPVASSPTEIADARVAILAGGDPLGERLCALWPAVDRRPRGAFYTAPTLVEPMLDWVLARDPARLVDPGCGSGRFAAGGIRRRSDLEVVAVDLDPIATLLTRAVLAVLGAQNATVVQADYTTLALPIVGGRTGFVGNPPYVRHHDLTPAAKAWAVAAGRRLGYRVSALAGLHAHFYLATALHAETGDVGCFVTSAEWLDVGYGAIVRGLFLDGLGGRTLHVVDPRANPFAGAMATAAIACFEVGTAADAIRLQFLQSPTDVADLDAGAAIVRGELAAVRRWSPLFRRQPARSGDPKRVPLGMLARVHRGAVTGANDFFVLTREQARDLGLETWCRPVIASAKEILEAAGLVRDQEARKLVLDVPPDVDRARYPSLDAYLRRGEQGEHGNPPVALRYIASRRRPWWHLGLSTPPIVATYMTRQAPAFALNLDRLAVLNIAHGIYPRDPLTPEHLAALVAALNDARSSFTGGGRTYHGGLEKFEPSEMEALLIPVPKFWRW